MPRGTRITAWIVLYAAQLSLLFFVQHSGMIRREVPMLIPRRAPRKR